ncbi:protein FAR1-RELATED SEQUENCE 5-like [Salvia hispanica]|uniref:protein FAR1-RELATED SEQUENCE 5-like n=1 Tax=Salvia hispanica TaxID=49212 RepID=UPI002009A825|nr:protein FAR1-RELATED SEQUENCE 5-like [Salvia hispanica]
MESVANNEGMYIPVCDDALKPMIDGKSRGYEVYQFVEYHNHLMVADEHRHFMMANRNLDPIHRRFMEDCGRCNIGPTLTFKLLKEIMGGPENVGCDIIDIRNGYRDIMSNIDGSDAQMIFDYMRSQKKSSDAFYYEIEIGSHGKLTRLFWADAISRRNYHMFGDVISFDSTYNTNRYCMIFAPFTGKDNHSRPVTFGAGLLSSEGRDSYSWLFGCFVRCMGVAPKLIITDQDWGIKLVVQQVLLQTRHRWCMWHIMVKVSDKLPKSLLGNEDFKKELNACVWSDLLEPDEFDIIWNDIMERYGLEDVHWFGSMFEDREFWVPAYFRDFPMGSLLRTTSMSESENSFFKNYTKPRANLVQFINFFNYAVGDQRNANSRLNYLDYSTIPDLSTQLPIEKHASTIYTDSIFKHVQQEISTVCEIVSITVEDNIKMHQVKDQYGRTWDVKYDCKQDTFDCSCKKFSRIGLLCCHIFCLLKNKSANLIPEKYFGRRWLKSSLLKAAHGLPSEEQQPFEHLDEKQEVKKKLFSNFYRLVQKSEGSMDHLSLLSAGLDDLEEHIFGNCAAPSVIEKKKMVEDFYGMAVPDVIDVHPPDVVSTKGSASGRVAKRESAIRKANKPLRRCGKCHELGRHDSRNCGRVNEKTD